MDAGRNHIKASYMICPICKNSLISDFSNCNRYKVCLNCNFYFQEILPPKVFEGPDENNEKGHETGHFMSNHDKEVNSNLANSLYQMFYPNTVLDIGTKYPFFLSVLKDRANVLGIDAISEIIKYGEELKVPVINADFEELDITLYKNKYDLITLIHVFEHFYDPLNAMEKIVSCLSNKGIIYIRILNIDVPGTEKDFTDHHLKIHPYIYSTQTIYFIAEKFGCEVFRIDKIEPGQSDFYLRKRKEGYTLSICMIVKNEERNITDCLESIKGIADEIIIVDTGSIDKTKEIISKYTDKIHDFKWIDDFSAARNYSLSKATCDWIVWLDADDIVKNPEEILPLLKEESFGVCNFNIIYGDDIFCQARLFRNHLNVRFAGRVHEYPILDGLILQNESNVDIIHKTEKHCIENRTQRNYRILKKELEESPNNTRVIFYMANALKELGQYDEAIEMYKKYLRIATWRDEKWMAQRYIGNILQWTKKYREAIEEFKKAIEIDDRWAESYYYIGECYFFLKEYEFCIGWMLKATQKIIPDSLLWKELSIYKEAPYRYLFVSYELLKKYKDALIYCKIASEKKPEDKWIQDRCIYFENMINNKSMIIECYRQGALGDCLMTTAALRGLKQKYPGCFIRYITHPHSRQILEGNKYIDEIAEKSKNDAIKKIYFAYPDKNSLMNEDYPYKPLKRHLIKIFNECAGLLNSDIQMECTLSQEEEKIGEQFRLKYGKYVTIHAKGGWSPYKNWYDDRWEIIIEELFKRKYITIQIGHNEDTLLRGAIDFRNHTIKEAIAVIKYASLHIGIDSFSNHASVVMGTPAVILFGSTSPTGSGYEQNINIYKSLSCQPCYKEYEWSKDHNHPCPYNKKCMDLTTVEEVLEAIGSFIFD